MSHVTTMTAVPFRTRFWLRVYQAGDCWIWRGARTAAGYGLIGLAYRNRLVHRLAYIWAKGPIPTGMEIDHRCRNRRCVKPSHLVAVTRREHNLRGNSLSARRARQTHCIRGHPFDTANTRINKNGSRFCRACGVWRRQRAKQHH